MNKSEYFKEWDDLLAILPADIMDEETEAAELLNQICKSLNDSWIVYEHLQNNIKKLKDVCDYEKNSRQHKN